MSPVGLLLFISGVVGYWVPAGCYANGKVTKSCGSMVPHHGVPGQTSHSPYRLETNTTAFSPGDQIQVILSGTSHFEGFLLQARDAANQGSESTVGTFILTDLERTQLLTCNKHQGSAVSHSSKAKKTQVVVFWKAPADAPRQVQFVVTALAHYNFFWVKLPGPIIYQHGVTPHPDITTPEQPTTTASILPGPFTSEGCGRSKSCLQDPPGCDPGDAGCFFLSMTTDGPDKMSVVFEMSGPAEGYIAFALSLDTWMGNDDVYMCVKDMDRVSVSAAFVSGRTYPDNQSQSGLSSVSWRLADGLILCRFSRPVRLTSEEPARYDLDQDYFLFLASGHAQYGALMLLAWMLTGSVGTFIASFYKHEWPNQTVLGQKVWFQVHRGLMMLTVALVILAFCLPFFYRRGWSEHAGVHPYLGCCVLALSLIQPIMAAMRPSPDSLRRYIFNWLHWGVGSVTEIMAVATMFLGVHQPSLLLPRPWATHVLIGYVIWLASFRFLLLMHKHLCIKKILGSDEHQQAILSDQLVHISWESFVKSLILAALALGNSGFLIALLSSIGEI